jgi:molybdate transport system permease protein
MTAANQSNTPPTPGSVGHRVPSNIPFFVGLILLAGTYLLLIAGLLAADLFYAGKEWGRVVEVLRKPEIHYAIKLSLISCSISAILSLWVAVPIGYLMSRYEFRGKSVVDAMLDMPIFLPPLVIGLSLLILFRQTFLASVDDALLISLHIPAVILAQFSVSSAFAVRSLRETFDEIPQRSEQVALTLGCSRSQAFWSVVMPEARHGLLAAFTLAWARSFGEFGPILIFAGSTRMRTEVLPVSVHLEHSAANTAGAVGVSLLMVVVAVTVLVVVRVLGGKSVGRGFR